MRRIAYFGSGEFSKDVLNGLLNYCDVDLVITKSDKEKGRGRVLLPTPVKELAVSRGIEVIDNENIKSIEFIDFLRSKDFDLFIVCDYGKIIPRDVFEIPRMRTVGIHPSLLPLYRGASPIQYALLNNEKITGTTVFYINEYMDAGDILIQKSIEISEDDDYFSLSEKLVNLSVDAIVEFLNDSSIKPIPQDESKATFTKIITKEDGRIDWSRDGRYIFGQIRAFVHWPKAFCFYKGKMVKILKARFLEIEVGGVFGEVVEVGKTIKVKTGKGVIEILEVLPENSKQMDARSFVNGYRVKVGDRFE